MKKEIVFAIILGLIFGGIVVFGVYQARRSLAPVTSTPSDASTSSGTVKPSSTPVSNGNLTIFAPKEDTFTTFPDLKISGTTYPDAFVAVVIDGQSYLVQADHQGNFTTSVKLDLGGNVVAINALSTDGQKATAERHVTYYSQSIENELDLPPEDQASSSATPSPKASSSGIMKKASPTPSSKPSATPKATPKATSSPKPSPTT